jgi:hypothetical protein
MGMAIYSCLKAEKNHEFGDALLRTAFFMLMEAKLLIGRLHILIPA